jgi:hypothetical protein
MGLSTVVAGRDDTCGMHVVEPRGVELIEAPPNMRMELTVLLGTRLAKRRARRSPSTPAAHPGRYADQH